MTKVNYNNKAFFVDSTNYFTSNPTLYLVHMFQAYVSVLFSSPTISDYIYKTSRSSEGFFLIGAAR